MQVLRQLNASLSVENLHVLDEHHFYQFHTGENELEFSLYGLGGNFLVSKKLFNKPIAGNGGKVWIAALAYELIKKSMGKDDSWFKKLWNINLPDVVDGHALLTMKNDKFSLETYSNVVKF